MIDNFEIAIGWGLLVVMVIVSIAIIAAIILFPILLWHQVFADKGKNVTLTIREGELWFCMQPDEHIECNFTEPRGNRFSVISDFIQFLGNGPTIEMEDKDNDEEDKK